MCWFQALDGISDLNHLPLRRPRERERERERECTKLYL